MCLPVLGDWTFSVRLLGMQKLALLGTSCTGKTACCDALRTYYAHDSSVVFVPEAARLYFTVHPDVTDRFSVLQQQRVQAVALTAERVAHALLPRVIVCDRTVLDAAAYVLATGDVAGSDTLWDNVATWMHTYTYLLLLDPVGVPYTQDSVRAESAMERERFHQGFLELLARHHVAYTLVDGSLEQRVRTARAMLR